MERYSSRNLDWLVHELLTIVVQRLVAKVGFVFVCAIDCVVIVHYFEFSVRFSTFADLLYAHEGENELQNDNERRKQCTREQAIRAVL